MTRPLGKGEVESSILSCSTIKPQENKAKTAKREKSLCADSRMNDSGTTAENWQGRGKRPVRIEGDVAYVPLTQGYVAVIDATDAQMVGRWNWTADVRHHVVYAKRSDTKTGRQVYLHRAILGDEAVGFDVDHRDCDGLNNRRGNLRTASRLDNMRNLRRSRCNSSGIKGVSFHKRTGKWRARIKVAGKEIALGLFWTADEARAAYADASAKMHGEFGRVA